MVTSARLSLTDYLDDVVRVSCCTAVALQGTGAKFALLIRGEDQASVYMQALLKTALSTRKLGMLAVEVYIDTSTAHKLSVAVVPQLRLFEGGKEIGRHRGTMEYADLVDALAAL